MATDIMGRQKNRISRLIPFKLGRGGLSLLLLACFFSTAHARVFGFTISPYISASQIYSDNLTLGQGAGFFPSNQPQGGFVTQLSPGINITRNSPRTTLNLSYRLQYLIYEGINFDPQLFNQLQMNSRTTLYEKSLFLDSSSSISQANAGAIGAFSPDNIFRSPFLNQTTFRTFRISPYWRPHLGGYADGELRVGYNYFGNDTASGVNPSNTIGNLGSNSLQQSIFLRNGRRFDSTGWTWRLSFFNQEFNYQATDIANVTFRNTNGEVSYRLIGDVSGFVQSGYYDNDFPTNNVTNTGVATNNGVYVTPGLSWTPSPKFRLAAGYGFNAYFGNLMWRPSQRTSFLVNYRNSQVGGQNFGVAGGGGLGLAGIGYGGAGGIGGAVAPGSGIDSTGGAAAGSGFATGPLGAANAGSIWNVSLQHRTRTTTWNASYYTSTATIQQYLSAQSTFTTPTDINGNPIGEATANDRAINLPNLTNAANTVFLSKRAQLSVSWFLSRSTYMLSAYQNNITYSSESSINPPQDIYGFTGHWNWRFSPRTSASIMGTWQTSDFQAANSGSGNQRTDFLNATVSLNRQISPYINAYLQYSYFQFDNNNVVNNLGAFDANRITATINVRF